MSLNDNPNLQQNNQKIDGIDNKRHEYYERNKEKIKKKSLEGYYENIKEKREKAKEYYHSVKSKNNELLMAKINQMTFEQKNKILEKIIESHSSYVISILKDI